MNRQTINKIQLICGIVMLLCGLVILATAFYDDGTTYTYVCGSVFTVVGIIYIAYHYNHRR